MIRGDFSPVTIQRIDEQKQAAFPPRANVAVSLPARLRGTNVRTSTGVLVHRSRGPSMGTSARNAAPIILAAAAAVAWGIVTAAPAVAEPGDSGATSPTVGDSPVLPIPISTIDRLWNQFVPPNPLVPQSPVATY